jgi:hypothetical protein
VQNALGSEFWSWKHFKSTSIEMEVKVSELRIKAYIWQVNLPFELGLPDCILSNQKSQFG